MRILLIEDEKKVAAFLKKGLNQEGYSVDVCDDGVSGIDEAVSSVHNLIILDVNLPDIDGFAVVKRCRAEGVTAPILMLTARGSVDDKVRGLEQGANDYLPKPFAFRELVARVRVLLRPAPQDGRVIRVGALLLDLIARRVERENKVIVLTNKEFALLEILMRHNGKPVSRAALWDQAWDQSLELDSNVLDVHVSRLRKKIDEDFKTPMIQTVYGVGYRIHHASS